MQKVQQKCSLKFAKCIVLEIWLPYFSSDINVKLNLWSNFVDFFLSNLMRTFLKKCGKFEEILRQTAKKENYASEKGAT